MSHRFNLVRQRKTPKPHARERTWFRWRNFHDIPNDSDKERIKKTKSIKDRMTGLRLWAKSKLD